MPPKEREQPILIPVDFSAHAEAALVCGADLAEILKAPLKILHVVHDPGEAPGYYAVKGRQKHLQKLEDIASEMLDEFLREVIKKHPDHPSLNAADKSLETGLVVNTILANAKKIDARMIIMGSQGRTGIAHILLGSTAEHIVRLSPIPVTIVKTKKKDRR